MPDNSLTRIYVPFSGVEADVRKSADGTEKPVRILKGLMTDESLDLDQQIVDFDWGTKQAEKWHSRWGNLREQHSSNAIGKSVELGILADQRAIDMTGRVIDVGAIDKIDEHILQGWSVGIKGARIVKDAKAPNGRIVGGEIVEVSLVDHPANENCKVALVKSAKTGKLANADQDVIEKIATTDADKLADVDAQKSTTTITITTDGDTNVADDGNGANPLDGTDAEPTAARVDSTVDGALGGSVTPVEPTGDKAVAADVAKALPTLDGDQKQHNKPLAQAWSAIQTLIQQESSEAAVDFGDVAWLARIGSDLQCWAADEAYEAEYAVYMAAMPQVAKLVDLGERKAAIQVLKAAETIITKTAAAKAEKSKEVAVEPTTAPVTEPTPAAEPDASKAVAPDTLKAAISEAVSKAVETAITPLREKVEEMAKRAAPGGPNLGPSKLLSAPKDILAAALASRVGQLDPTVLQDAAENHPDATIRMGAKQLLADLTKTS